MIKSDQRVLHSATFKEFAGPKAQRAFWPKAKIARRRDSHFLTKNVSDRGGRPHFCLQKCAFWPVGPKSGRPVGPASRPSTVRHIFGQKMTVAPELAPLHGAEKGPGEGLTEGPIERRPDPERRARPSKNCHKSRPFWTLCRPARGPGETREAEPL